MGFVSVALKCPALHFNINTCQSYEESLFTLHDYSQNVLINRDSSYGSPKNNAAPNANTLLPGIYRVKNVHVI